MSRESTLDRPRAIYREEVVDRAREHVEAGWSVKDTCKLLGKEYGYEPHWATVRGWTDPEYAERRRMKDRKNGRRYKARKRKTRNLSPELRLERMCQLREAGLSFRGIGVVSRVLWAIPLSEEQVRAMLRKAL